MENVNLNIVSMSMIVDVLSEWPSYGQDLLYVPWTLGWVIPVSNQRYYLQCVTSDLNCDRVYSLMKV